MLTVFENPTDRVTVQSEKLFIYIYIYCISASALVSSLEMQFQLYCQVSTGLDWKRCL